MKNCFFSFLLVCTLFIYTDAQMTARTGCGTDHYLQAMKKNQLYKQRETQVTGQWKTYKQAPLQIRRDEVIYTLPVVFHIIHKNGPENIPDEVVMDAFQRLNDAFANRAIFDQGSGVDTKIQFCLVSKDPDGNFSTGITRTYADLLNVVPEVHDQFLKSLINWDPTRYINIWIVNEVDKTIEFNRCGYEDLEDAGYATLPPAHGSNSDGLVAEARNLSTIIVHEMGHYLGLYHTFEGYCSNRDCNTDGDQVCDTPPEETISITGSCTDPENSCQTDILSGFTTDQDDLKTNHMDYGNNACQHDFTQGQKDRMRFMIETIRISLLTSDACVNDCGQPAEAEFSFTSTIEYTAGNTVQFTNTSTGAESYEWFVNNEPVSFMQNLVYTFPRQGWFKIELLAKPFPDETKCRNRQLNWIRVYCSIKPVIEADKEKAMINETVHFSSSIRQIVSSAAPVRYEWYQNGLLFGTSPSFDYSFTSPGLKEFYLVTIQGSCRDTSMADIIDIKPLPDYTLNINTLVCVGQNDKKVKFSVCNDGFRDLPEGLPITFYDSNPTTGAASMVGNVFYTGEVISEFCCKDFEFELPQGYNGQYLFGVINDDHSLPAPYNLETDFPVTSFPETNYRNNLDSVSLEKFRVAITPGEATIVLGGVVTVSAFVNQQATVQWQADNGTFSCDTCNSTAFTPTSYSRVILKGTSTGNCVAYDTIFVKVLANGELFIPTAFTPNNDNLNDYFYVMGGEPVIKISSFLVFNRWGELVFSKQNTLSSIPSLGWNGTFKGKKAASGVYVYLIRVALANGTEKQLKGFVTLIR